MVPFKILARERMRHSFYSRLSLTAPLSSSRVRIWRQRITSQKVQILMSAEWDNNYSSIVMSWLRSRRDSTNMNIRLSGQYLQKHFISPHNTAIFSWEWSTIVFCLRLGYIYFGAWILSCQPVNSSFSTSVVSFCILGISQYTVQS